MSTSSIDALVAIEAYVKSQFPDITIEKQTVPDAPAPGLLVLRQISDNRSMETLSWYRVDRDYQLLYFTKYAEEGLPLMDELSNVAYDGLSLPEVPLRFISFGYGPPELTDNKIYVTTGILRTETRQKRRLPDTTKMNDLHIRRVPENTD